MIVEVMRIKEKYIRKPTTLTAGVEIRGEVEHVVFIFAVSQRQIMISTQFF